MNQPEPTLVSIIIPTYNRASLIGKTLTSILAQTYPHFEIIVADDGSTDDTAAVVARFGDRIRYLPLPHTGLPAAARNAAIAVAQGDYLAFCDSDDLWQPEKLARQVAVLDSNLAAGLTSSDALVWLDGEDAPSEDRYLQGVQGMSGRVLHRLLHGNFIINSSVMLRRSVLAVSGLISEDKRVCGMEDFDCWLRIAALSEIVFLDEPLVIYRSSPTSLSGAMPRVENWQGRLYLLQRIQAFLRERALLSRELRREFNRATSDLLIGLAGAQTRAGNRPGAMHALWRLLCVRPRTFIKQTVMRLLRLGKGERALPGFGKLE